MLEADNSLCSLEGNAPPPSSPSWVLSRMDILCKGVGSEYIHDSLVLAEGEELHNQPFIHVSLLIAAVTPLAAPS